MICEPVLVLHLVQVVGAGVHPLPQDVPLLSSEEPPEGGEAVDLQAVQPDRHERDQRHHENRLRQTRTLPEQPG